MHHHHPYDPAIAERKQKNRDIFAETMRICRRVDMSLLRVLKFDSPARMKF